MQTTVTLVLRPLWAPRGLTGPAPLLAGLVLVLWLCVLVVLLLPHDRLAMTQTLPNGFSLGSFQC